MTTTSLALRDSALLAAGPSPIEVEGLDPQVLQLALAAGLLRPKAGSPGVYELDPLWFTDPVGKTGDAFKTHGAELAGLLAQLLGNIGGKALGIPIKDPGHLGTWYPIQNPETGTPTGLYLTSNTVGGETVFGIGTTYIWPLGADLEVRAWGMVPLVAVGNGNVSVVAGSEKYPLNCGVEFAGKTAIIDRYGFSFKGVKLSASLSLLPQPKPDISIVVMQLKLPTDLKASDRSLADLTQLTGEQILTTVSSLFVSALSEALGAGDKKSIDYLLPVLGLTTQVPDALKPIFPDVVLPLMRWDQLAAAVVGGGSPTEPFKNWFNALLSNPKVLEAWLSSIQGLQGVPTPLVTGAGTRQDPYAISILDLPSIGALSFTIGTTVDEQGTRTFYPGIDFTGTKMRLGTSSAAVQITASVELAQFRLSTTGAVSADPTSLLFDSGICLVGYGTTGGKDDPLFSGKVAGQDYVFGSLCAGLKIGNATGTLQVIPRFTLNGVTTPTGSYASIDLTQPGNVVDQALDEVIGLIRSALLKLFGIEGSDKTAPGYSIAALLGIVAPDSGATAWPASLAPPLSSAEQIRKSVQDPVGNLLGYWGRLLSDAVLVDGQIPFYFMVKQAGTLLVQVGGPAVTVTGKGTPAEPWRVELSLTANLPASLQVWMEDLPAAQTATAQMLLTGGVASTRKRLVAGFGFTPKLKVSETFEIDLDFTLDALGLDLDTSGGVIPTGVQIFPGAGFSLDLPKGVTTPQVAGASLSVSRSSLSVYWSPYDGWSWSMVAGAPTLTMGGQSFPVGETMNFSDAESLQKLVTEGAATFGQVLTGVAGMAVYQSTNRVGLAIDGILGLLPNLGPLMPPGITWPADMPVLRLTSFSDPLGALRGQINAIVTKPDRLKAALQLMAWAATSNTNAPAIPGTGTLEDPFHVPLGLVSGVGLAVWSNEAAGTAGVGIDHSYTYDLPKDLQAVTRVVLRLVNGSLATGALVPLPGVPGGTLNTLIRPKTGKLVPLTSTGFSLGSLSVGIGVSAEGTIAAPVLKAKPYFMLYELQFPGQPVVAQVNIAEAMADDSAQQALLQAFDRGLQVLFRDALGDGAYEQVYALLVQIGLAVPVETPLTVRGINPPGWLALLADPLGFASQRLLALVTDAQALSIVSNLLRKATGVNPPSVPRPLLVVLNAMGLVQDEAHGWVPDPPGFVQLFSHPAQYLSTRFKTLLGDPLALKDVVSQLVQISEPVPFGPFQLEVLSGPVVRVALAPGKAQVGSLLDFSGAVSLSFATRPTLGVALRLFNPLASLALVPALTVDFTGGTTSFTLQMAWGDGTQPAPPPLQFWPFNANEFVTALSEVAPFYALSVIVSQVIDPLVLQRYPVAQVVLNALGVASQDTGGVWHTKSLLGLFDDPLAWLLGDAVLGANGQLNITKINQVLTTMPETTFPSVGIGTKKIADGFQVYGLPYQMAVDFTAVTATNKVTIRPKLSAALPIAGNLAKIEKLAFGISLGPNFQPGLDGNVVASATIPGAAAPLALDTGFDKTFYLRVTDGTQGGMALQLVPFPGWQELIKGAVQVFAQQLLPQLTSKLLQALRENGAREFADALSSAGTKLDVSGLVTALLAAAPDAKKLETASLGWLGGRFTTANVNNTAAAVVDLLKVAGLTLTATGGLISYKASNNVIIMVGAQKLGTADQVGAWVGVTLPPLSILQVAVDVTGIGMPYDPSTGAFTSPIPLFNFGLALSTPIAGESRAPRLTLQFDNATKKFTSGLDLMGSAVTRSDLYRELLPNFFGNPPDLGKAITDWLILVLTQAAPRYVSIVLLNQTTIKGWLDGPLLATTPGQVLDTAGLIRKENGKYVLRSFDEILALTVPQFVANLLKALLSAQFTVITFSNDRGSIVVGTNPSGAVGIRATVRNIALPGAPNFVFQLGAADKDWLRDAALVPGVGVYVPLTATAPEFQNTQVELVNLGVDFVGAQQKPLVDLSRFTLGAVKPRGMVLFDFKTGVSPVKWGGAITLGDIGITFAPNTAVQGQKTNPVAQNLLGSGTKAAAPGSTPANPPTNPAFSASASFIKGDTFPTITFFNGSEKSATEIWVPVQRTFGPLNVNQLGLSWRQSDTHLGALFDGSVTLAGLFVGMKKLGVSFNVKNPTDYTQYELDVQGLDVQFRGGPVTLSGGFFKQDSPLRYDGMAMLRAASFGLDALGSFGVIPVDPNDPVCKVDPNSPDCRKAISLFVFVNLNVPLGGPPEFFVEGLAAGFGFNRSLVIPGPGDIGEFPLVAGAINPDYFPKDADGKADPTKALMKLGTTVPPAIGVYWVGAGLKFSTYQFLSTFALLFLKFGREFEIDLVGVMSASLPPKSPKTIAYVELAVIASFKPAEGLVSLRGQLTPNSYILAPPVKLTGGFAIMFWYAGEHAGNFVITLGGYHPSFEKPDYYPDVPRVGILWKVDVSVGRLMIEGGAYFALTPSAFMAGGNLRAAFEMGPIRAWLDAGANFLIQWNPFYYEVEIHISVGVAFKTEIAGVSVTLSASLGALLELWGPPTAGRARIDWYVISFTIPIGEQDKELTTEPLATWNDFSQAFFPQPVAPKTNQGVGTAGDPVQQEVIKTTAALGLVAESGPHGWLINPSAWRMTVSTLVPASTMTVTKAAGTLPSGPPMGVRPMNVPGVTTPLTVTMQGFDTTTSQWVDVDLAAKKIVTAAVPTGAPAALWSKDPLNPVAPPDPKTSLLPNANSGVTLDGVQVRCKDKIGPMPLLRAFGYVQRETRFYPLPPVWTAPAALNQANAFHRLMATIMAPDVVTTRNTLFQVLRDHGVPAVQNPQLSVLAFFADSIYTAPPALAQLGTDLGSTTSTGTASKRIVLKAGPAPEPAPSVTLLGSAHRYESARTARPPRADRDSVPALRLDAPRLQGTWVERGGPSRPTGSMRLSEGTTAVYSLTTPSGRNATARVAGDLPVRLLAFNKHDELLAEVVTDGGDTTLPAGTAKVAMQGARAADEGRAVGWQHDTMLARVARYTFAGDGCLVRPQATPVRRRRGRFVERGLVEASRVLADNRVRESGRVRSGWVETLLPGATRTVAVVISSSGPSGSSGSSGGPKDSRSSAFSPEELRGTPRNPRNSPSDVRVRLTPASGPWTHGHGDEATPREIVEAAGGFILFFDVPVSPELSLAVLVETDRDDLVLQGVWGILPEAGEASQSWSSLVAHAVGTSIASRAARTSTVTLDPAGARAQEAANA
ncbi:MAG TPA: DUF6603 domain-containing protein [Thermoanaerobaculia bacterium]